MKSGWFLVAILAGVGAAAAEPAPSGILTYDAPFFADARPSTAFDMVKRLPGFTFDSGASARGFAGTAGNVLIDGERPTTKTDGLDSILQRISASQVERIELIRGGAPGIDMQGQTVVADIILKKADATILTAAAGDTVFLDGRMVPSAKLEFTRHAGPEIYEGSISTVSNWDDSVGRGIHDVFDGAGTLVEHDLTSAHGQGIGGVAKGAVTLPLLGGEFKTNLLFQDSPFIDSLSYDSAVLHQIFIDKSRDNSSELGLHWKGTAGPLEVEALMLQRLVWSSSISTADDTVTLQDFRSRSATGESIARTTVRYLPRDSLTFESGAEAAYNFLDGKTNFFVNSVAVPLPSANVHVQEMRAEVFGQGTWKLSDSWLFEAGARLEFSRISETGDTKQARSFFYPKPRAVLTWTPEQGTQVRFRYERVVGQLDFNNFIATSNLSSTGVTAGNANLRPDQRTQYELTLEQHFWDKGAITLSLMHEDIKDVVDFVPVTGSSGTFDAPGNIGNGTNEQLSLSLMVPLDKLGITDGLIKSTDTLSLGRVRDPVTGRMRVISAERPQDINVTYQQDVNSLNSTFGVSYYNGWTEDTFRLQLTRQRRVVPPYLSVFWDFKPTSDWSFHIEADNIIGYVYDDVRDNFSGPRNTSPLVSIDEYRVHSQATVNIQIRHTFD